MPHCLWEEVPPGRPGQDATNLSRVKCWVREGEGGREGGDGGGGREGEGGRG